MFEYWDKGKMTSQIMNISMDMDYFAEIENFFNLSQNWTHNDSLLQYLEHGTLKEGSVKSGTNPGFSEWIQAAWISIFGGMIFVATCGNAIVIWIVIGVVAIVIYVILTSRQLDKDLRNAPCSLCLQSHAHRRMRTVTNYFLVNLSVADLLLTLFNCIFNSIYMIQRNWPFGTRYCTISNFIANSTVTASVLTLTAISCDRYLAIVHPLHPRMSRTSSLVAICFIWTASMIFASPCLLYSATVTHRYRGSESVGCIMIWPDNQIVGSKYDLGYQMLFLVVAYLVPMTLMSACYAIMGRVLWGSKSIGELTQRQLDSIQSKRKVVKMFILVVLIFGLCWLPYHSYFIYIYYDPRFIYSRYTQHIYLTFYWLAMSNAMVNPLIYYWMNARFRQYFRKAVCCWKVIFCSTKDPNSLPPTARNSINSYSQSGAAGASVKKHRSHSLRQNGNMHYALIPGTNGIFQEKERRMSNRATRTTSLKKDLRKTTFL